MTTKLNGRVLPPGTYMVKQKTCPACGGGCLLGDGVCPQCGGLGSVVDTATAQPADAGTELLLKVAEGLGPVSKPTDPNVVSVSAGVHTFTESHRAFGRKPADAEVPKWAIITAHATRCGGREAEGGFIFPDAHCKQQFDLWYAKNAPSGLTVRSRVAEKVAPGRAPPKPLTEQQIRDDEFINYCAQNCTVPGFPFSSDQMTRMRALCGSDYRPAIKDGISLESEMRYMVDVMRARMQPTEPPVVTAPAPAVAPQFRTLKELRMWHWRKVVEWRKYATDWEARMRRDGLSGGKTQAQADNCHAHANLHLSAVQVLNDSVPGTAERDCAEEDAIDDLFDRSEHPPRS